MDTWFMKAIERILYCMKKIEIFWNDLTAEKQKEIQEELNFEGDNNWTYFPMATIEIEE